MGCGLKKLKPLSEENSPGKIYSTLKRPQVETRAGPTYTYRFLDFIVGKDGGTSTLSLSSVRELPSQLSDLYCQGFVLVALHTFVQHWSSDGPGPEQPLYRAILVRTNDGSDRGPSLRPHALHLEECLSADQQPTAELIQGYVKKQVQDAADQGALFVGFIQESTGASCRREPPRAQTSSLSLHSSPSSVLGSLSSGTDEGNREGPLQTGPSHTGPSQTGLQDSKNVEPVDSAAAGKEEGKEVKEEESAPCGPEEECNIPETNDIDNGPEQRCRNGGDLLALYDLPAAREPSVRFYTVKVPVRVQRSAEGTIRGLDGPWLDHMTQHFSGGASLVHGHFCLGPISDVESRSAESVFIFQEPSESEGGAQAFDAIVVEQWTVIQGLQVKADYVPLLQSLASFGWRLTCVLPTPVIRTNSDGTLSTKQMVFLQRPVLSRKKKDSKKLIFKSRSKNNKNCIKDTSKTKRSQNQDRDQDRLSSGGAPHTSGLTEEAAAEEERTKERTDVTENGLDTDSENQSGERGGRDQEVELTAANQSAAGSQE